MLRRRKQDRAQPRQELHELDDSRLEQMEKLTYASGAEYDYYTETAVNDMPDALRPLSKQLKKTLQQKNTSSLHGNNCSVDLDSDGIEAAGQRRTNSTNLQTNLVSKKKLKHNAELYKHIIAQKFKQGLEQG